MPIIREQIYLECTPREAFRAVADMNFVNIINPGSDVENEILFQNERLIRYKLKVKNVGEWESERILIPELNTIVTKREKPLSPFNYMVILHVFSQKGAGTILTYSEEFEMDSLNLQNEKKVLDDITNKIKPNLAKMVNYFQQANI